MKNSRSSLLFWLRTCCVSLRSASETAASFTVEASLILSVVLPLLITSLFISEYLCDRVRAEAVLSEAAVRTAAEESADISGKGGFFFLSADAMQIRNTAGDATAVLKQDAAAGLVRTRTDLRVSCTKRKPVRLLRRILRIRALIGA